MKLNKQQILRHFIQMIQIPTVSHIECSMTDRNAFIHFRRLILTSYPTLLKQADHWLIGDYGLLIRIPGISSEDPAILMAHYDVVDANPDEWTFPPFGGIRSNGKIYGRGTLDTKSTLCAILEAAECFCSSGSIPEHDIYLAFGGEEEVSGPTAGNIAAFLKARNVTPDFILDEGGAVIPEGVPGVHRTAAMIGIAEKGTANYKLTISLEKGGHASVPPRHTAIGRLAKAAVRIERHPFPAGISDPVRIMFREIADAAPKPVSIIFRHADALAPAITLGGTILGGSFNAMVRSTTAITVMNSQPEYNVLPATASLGINVRLISGDTVESVRTRLEKTVNDPLITVETVSGSNPSPTSDISCSKWDLLTETIRDNWPGIAVAPYQLNGGTDSRFYAGLSSHIYRFSPMEMTAEERSTVHGIDEAIREEQLYRMTVFFLRLIKKL